MSVISSLREYQKDIFEQVIATNVNCIFQADTGSGKTKIITALAEHYRDNGFYVYVIAHRNLLISQLSISN